MRSPGRFLRLGALLYGQYYRVPDEYIGRRVLTRLKGESLFIESGKKVIAQYQIKHDRLDQPMGQFKLGKVGQFNFGITYGSALNMGQYFGVTWWLNNLLEFSMARPLRNAFEGTFYHVTARGDEGRKIFLSHRDYEKFLIYLADALCKYGVILHAFVLMPNHYHLLLETPRANLSSFMHNLNSAYTTYFNIKRGRSGHLFQGRYKGLLIDGDNYLLELSCYIHLNPVRAGIAGRPEDYPYSSYRGFIFPKREAFNFRELIWDMVRKGGRDRARSYREFVETAFRGQPKNPSREVYGGVILGRKRFIQGVLQRLRSQGIQKKEVAYRRSLEFAAPDIDEIVDLLCIPFKISKEKVQTTSPYKG